MHYRDDVYKRIVAGEYSIERCVQFRYSGNIANIYDDTVPGDVYGEDTLISMQTKRGSFGGNESPAIGQCYSSMLKIKMKVKTSTAPKTVKIVPYVRVKNSTEASSWFPQGIYFSDTKQRTRIDVNDITTEIVAYDSMMKAEEEYVPSITLPATDQQIVFDIARQMDVTVLGIINKGFIIQSASGYTKREMLGMIALMYGGNFLFDENGYLSLKKLYYSNSSVFFTLPCEKMYIGENYSGYSGVVLNLTNGNGVKYTSGSTTGYTLNCESPYATQDIADNIYSAVYGFVYKPLKAEKVITQPALMVGDKVSICGIAQNAYFITTKYLGKMVSTIEAPDINEIEHLYPYVPPAEKESSRAYSAAANAEKIAEDTNELYQDLSVKVGNVESGMSNYVLNKTFEAYQTAVTTTYATIDDVDSKLENKVTIDGDEKTASALISASAGSAVASIEAIATKSSGGSKTLVQILSDSVNLNNIAYVNKGQGQQNDTLSVRGSTSMSGNLLVAGDINLPNTSSKITFGYDEYSPKPITFAYDPTTGQKLTDFYVLAK